MVEHVIYSHDPDADPGWTYRSRPIACIGMADTLAAAREDFREALELALDDEQVPDVIEHLERPHPDEFWVRIRLGAGARERDYAAHIFLNTWAQSGTRRDGPPPLIARSRTDIGEPIVIACLPTDSIGSVVEQLNEGESCAVLLSSVNIEEGYEQTWISGIAVGPREDLDYPAASLDEQGLSLDSTMDELMVRSIAARQKNKPHPLLIVA